MNGRVCAIVDIDGTLVDTNYHHTVAWGRAFAEHGVRLPLWRIHRHNGMGGDQLVASVAGEDTERRLGDAVRASESRHYGELIGEVAPLPGAADLLRGLHELGVGVILASSAKPEEVERYVELLDAGDHVDAFTSGGDVDRTKPEPDLIVVAMRKAESAEQFVMIGDTTWDAIAAGRLRRGRAAGRRLRGGVRRCGRACGPPRPGAGRFARRHPGYRRSMTLENIPQMHERERAEGGEPVKEAAKAGGRLLLWVVLAVAAVAVVLGVVFLGPFGLAILVPALIAIWLAAGAAAGGPAAGA
jgi:HAD superfamily hydrolase (TIGR01549 family)